MEMILSAAHIQRVRLSMGVLGVAGSDNIAAPESTTPLNNDHIPDPSRLFLLETSRARREPRPK